MKQTLLNGQALKELGAQNCPKCGAGYRLGEMCIYVLDDGQYQIGCRDCEDYSSPHTTLAEAVAEWNKNTL